MGILDMIFGGSAKSKIDKFKKKKDARSIAAYLKSEDAGDRQYAIDTLVELLDSGQLTQTDQSALMEILDPIVRIKDKRRIDAINSPFELRNIAINEYLKKLDVEMALYALNRALELKPDDLNLKNNLAATYSRGDNFDKAQEIWEEILKNNASEQSAIENYTTALYLQANKLFKKKNEKDWTKGADYLIKALELNPNHVNSMHDLAEFYVRTKTYDKAVYYYNKLLNHARIPTGYNSASEMKGYICRKIADAQIQAKNYEDARSYLMQARSVYQWDNMEMLKIEKALKEIQGK